MCECASNEGGGRPDAAKPQVSAHTEIKPTTTAIPPQTRAASSAGNQQHRFQEELRKSQAMASEARHEKERALAMLDGLLETAPLGFASVDRQLRFVRVSQFLARTYRIKPEKWIGREVDQVLPAALAHEVAGKLREVLRTGQAIPEAEVCIQDRKTLRHWRVNYFPISTPEGELFGVGMLAIEITAQKHHEAILQEQKDVAERANAAKDHLLAMISHELRVPLAPVLSTVVAMEDDPHHTPAEKLQFQMMRRNVELEARLIDDLLDLTRIARGKLVLQPVPVDLHLIVRNAVEICLSDILGKKLELRLDLKAQQTHLRGDPARLQQVMWNLIRNAVKFTPEGGQVQILTRDRSDGAVRPGGSGIVIEVSDTGMGIEPEKLSRIFDAFEQGDVSVTKRFGGLGLGLTISKSLVEAHGGTLVAHSAGRDAGATFTVTLPGRRRPHRKSTAGEPVEPAVRRLAHILLVDDHADTLSAMRRLLERSGHAVQTATTLADARQVAQQQAIDLLISDIGLPDGSGLELVAELLSAAPGKLKAIALSGYGAEDDIRRSKEAGFHAHLTKPINLGALEAVIAQLMAE